MNLPILKAQDSSIPLPTDCSAETVLSILTLTSDALNQALTNFSSMTPEDAANALNIVNLYIGMLKATCDKLSFAGDTQSVLGPVLIPAGLYKATFTTDGAGVVTVTATSGKCGQGTGSLLLPGLFFANKGDASGGLESILKSAEDCNALIEITTKDAWTLRFEKVG